MADVEVIFTYIFEHDDMFDSPKYTHPFPRRCCRNPGIFPRTPEPPHGHLNPKDLDLANDIYQAIAVVGGQHVKEFEKTCGQKCEMCQKPRVKITQVPMTNGMEGPQPQIACVVAASCGAEACERQLCADVYQQARDMANMGLGLVPQGPRGEHIKRSFRCEHCLTWGGVRKCAGCQYIGYCGRECQKAHWKTHKPDCHKDHPPPPSFGQDVA